LPDLRHAADVFFDHPSIELTTLFGPQHGIRGDVQDNTELTSSGKSRQQNLLMLNDGHGTFVVLCKSDSRKQQQARDDFE